MSKLNLRPQCRLLIRLLLLGWRKGRAMHDPLMWVPLVVSLFLPAMLLVTGNALTQQDLWATLTSPLFWLLPMAVFVLFIARLYYLATSIGCVRQIDFSEDGQPSPCQIDLGHRECCKHIGPDGGKADCRYWRPELIID